jgi:hypothetical protein
MAVAASSMRPRARHGWRAPGRRFSRVWRSAKRRSTLWPARSRCACRAPAPHCGCCSGCATRHTASRTATTASSEEAGRWSASCHRYPGWDRHGSAPCWSASAACARCAPPARRHRRPARLLRPARRADRRAPAPANVIRTRFAPSPTGSLHVGNARIAVLNWLFTRRRRRFVLRIEDTDIERNVPAQRRDPRQDLLWLGLDWDEGPGQGPWPVSSVGTRPRIPPLRRTAARERPCLSVLLRRRSDGRYARAPRAL